jgi:hypothetical protein
MGFQFVTHQNNFSASTTGAWTAKDASTLLTLPDTASGLLLRIRNNSSSTAYSVGLRKPGSTDNRIVKLSGYYITYAYVGLSATKTFEYYKESTYIVFDLLGYTTNNVVFLTNAVDKSPASPNVDTVTSCATEAPGAIGLIWELDGSLGYNFRAYKTGAAAPPLTPNMNHNCFGFVTGCDTSQQVTLQTANTAFKFYLVGYILGDAYFPTTLTQLIAPPAAGTGWRDSTIAVPAGYNGVIDEQWPTTVGVNSGIQPKGSTENYYGKCSGANCTITNYGTSNLLQLYLAAIANTDNVHGFTQNGIIKRGLILRRVK